jgi:hypothetical protein
MAEFIDVAWSMTEVFCLLEVDEVCSVARRDESLGGAGNFVATNDRFDGTGSFVATERRVRQRRADAGSWFLLATNQDQDAPLILLRTNRQLVELPCTQRG